MDYCASAPIIILKKMITALLVTIGAIMVVGSAIMLLGLAEAPEGYEDGEGFHFGPEP